MNRTDGYGSRAVGVRAGFAAAMIGLGALCSSASAQAMPEGKTVARPAEAVRSVLTARDKIAPALQQAMAALELPGPGESLAEENPVLTVGVWLRLDEQPPTVDPADFGPAGAVAPAGQQTLQQIEAIVERAQGGFLAWVNQVGGAVAYVADHGPLVYVKLTPAQIEEAAARFDVDFIDQSVEHVSEMEHAAKTVRADVAWARGVTGSGALTNDVGFIEIRGRPNFGNAFLQHIPNTAVQNPGGPTTNHSASVAGVIAAQANAQGPNERYRGIAYGLRGLSCSNTADGFDATVAASIDWQIARGSRVVNMSFGYDNDGAITNLERYIDFCSDTRLVLFIKSAGNEGNNDDVTAPGLAYNILAVGSFRSRANNTWRNDSISNFSSAIPNPGQRGWRDRDEPDIAAVGEDESGSLHRVYANGSIVLGLPGTSFAAPQVTGAVGLLFEAQTTLAVRPELTRAILLAGACHNIEGDEAFSNLDGAGGMVICESLEIVENNQYAFVIAGRSGFNQNDANGSYLARSINLKADLPARVVIAYNARGSNTYGHASASAIEGNTITDADAPFGDADSKVGWYVQLGDAGEDERAFRVVGNTTDTLVLDAPADFAGELENAGKGTPYTLFEQPEFGTAVYRNPQLQSDFDLRVFSPGGALVATSNSFDQNHEVVEFTPATTGNYEVRIYNFRQDAGVVERIGLAWAQDPCCSPDFGDAPDNMTACPFRPDRGDFPTLEASDGARVGEFEIEWLSFNSTTEPGATWETDANVDPFAAEKDEDGISNIIPNACITDQDGDDDGVRPQLVYIAGGKGYVTFQVNSATPDIGRYQNSFDERIHVYGWFDWEHDDTTWAGNQEVYWVGGPGLTGRTRVGNCIRGCDLWDRNSNSKTVEVEFDVPPFLPEGPFWIRFRAQYGYDPAPDARFGNDERKFSTYGEVEDHLSSQFRWLPPIDCVRRLPDSFTTIAPSDAVTFSSSTLKSTTTPSSNVVTFEGEPTIFIPEDLVPVYWYDPPIVPPQDPVPPVTTPRDCWTWTSTITRGSGSVSVVNVNVTGLVDPFTQDSRQATVEFIGLRDGFGSSEFAYDIDYDAQRWTLFDTDNNFFVGEGPYIDDYAWGLPFEFERLGVVRTNFFGQDDVQPQQCFEDPVEIEIRALELASNLGGQLVTENEFNCGIPDDFVNGGCDAPEPLFIDLNPGDAVAGTTAAQFEQFSQQPLGDNDWYRIFLEQPTEVTVTMESSTKMNLEIIDTGGAGGCFFDFVTGLEGPAFRSLPGMQATVFPCQQTTLSAQLQPGVHYIKVSPVLDGIKPCGQHGYALAYNDNLFTIGSTGACCGGGDFGCFDFFTFDECDGLGDDYAFTADRLCSDVCDQSTELGACCFDDNTCEILSDADCLSTGGIAFAGPGSQCGLESCPDLPTGACCVDRNGCELDECILGLTEGQCDAIGSEPGTVVAFLPGSAVALPADSCAGCVYADCGDINRDDFADFFDVAFVLETAQNFFDVQDNDGNLPFPEIIDWDADNDCDADDINIFVNQVIPDEV